MVPFYLSGNYHYMQAGPKHENLCGLKHNLEGVVVTKLMGLSTDFVSQTLSHVSHVMSQ
jgi:hypothetical protein